MNINAKMQSICGMARFSWPFLLQMAHISRQKFYHLNKPLSIHVRKAYYDWSRINRYTN
jgi:hypothetical protein